MTARGERNPEVVTLHIKQAKKTETNQGQMNSADVFSLEFDMLTRTSSLGKILERFRATEIGAGTHRQLLLELNHVINVHSRLREVAADVVPPDECTFCRRLSALPSD